MPFRDSIVPVAFASLVLVGCGDKESTQPPPPAPPAEHPLLGAPEPAKPTERGVFIKDPEGQVERIAAGGHFVAGCHDCG